MFELSEVKPLAAIFLLLKLTHITLIAILLLKLFQASQVSGSLIFNRLFLVFSRHRLLVSGQYLLVQLLLLLVPFYVLILILQPP